MKNITGILYFFLLVLLAACGGGGGSGSSVADTPPEVTPPVVTPSMDPGGSDFKCLAPDYPNAVISSLQIVAAFPSLPAISGLVGLYQQPDDSRYYYAISLSGIINRFDNSPVAASFTPFLDLTAQTSSGGETGLLGFAFHPDYSSTGWAFVYYMPSSSSARLSRFSLNPAGDVLDKNSEKIILTVTQPAGNHNGGGLAFGPGGYLYLSLGDGGGQGDTFDNGQNTRTLLGTMLRLDINVSDDTQAYTIPADNPFSDGQAGLAEIYAYGLRNPWRWSFDRISGDLWLGDVGQNAIEEVDIIEAGGNYGWPIMEGNSCYNSNQCDQSGLVKPVVDYSQNDTGGCAVTGGYVYRGNDLPGATGNYIFGDYCSGIIYALIPGVNGYSLQEMIDTSLFISSFAEDNSGELYALNLNGGTGSGIFKIVAGNTQLQTSLIPEKLSATGCYSDMSSQITANGVVAYDVNSPLWSDGAGKKRFFSLAENSKFTIGGEGDFFAPDNAIIMKSFYFDNEIIETRLLMKHLTGWAGYSYEWNDEKTEASLLESAKQVLIDENYTHIFPSGAQCFDCHTAAAGMTLGIETLQLNHGATENYLDTLFELGYLQQAVPSSLKQEKLFALDDFDASLQQKAKSYLHSNCSGCHRPGGPISGIDLRFTTELAGSGLCNENPGFGDLGVAGAKLLVPGDASRSVLSLRMYEMGDFRMPPLGSLVIDSQAVLIIDQWINSLADCD